MEAIKLKSKFLDQLTDDEFYHFCQEHRDLRIERNHQNEIIIISPTGGKTGECEGEVLGQLYAWNIQAGLGKVFSASTGYKLPDTSIRAADASWISTALWNSIPEQDRERFLPVAPEFAIEIKSPSDSLSLLQQKMATWIRNGCKIALLIEPKKKMAYKYDEDGHITTFDHFEQEIALDPLLPGFKLDLKRLG